MQPSPSRRLPERTHDEFRLPAGAVAGRQAASAALWLARFAGSWLPAEAGHAHLMLRFEPDRGVLVSRPAVAGLSLELSLADLSMQILEGGTPSPHRMDLEDRTPANIEAWLLVELLHRGIDQRQFSKALPWSVGGLMTGDSEEFTPESLAVELDAIVKALVLAQPVLAEVAGIDPRDVLLHTDTFHLSVPSRSQTGARTEFGLAAGNASVPEPHFYVAPALPRPSQAAPADFILTMSDIARRSMDAARIVAELRGAAASPPGVKATE